MGMVTTILTAQVQAKRWPEMVSMYQEGGKHKPPQLVQGFLVQSTGDPTGWQTVCIWQSPEALEEYRSSGMPGGVQTFRSVGAEATEEEFDVAHQML
jgi:hypothetical protein